MKGIEVRTRTVRRARAVALVGLLSLGPLPACGTQEDARSGGGHREGEDHDAEMARDGEAALQQSLAEAAGKPPVIDPEEVIRRKGASLEVAAQRTPRVRAPNAALVRLVELHRAHDSARLVDAEHAIDQRAYAIHLEADTYENEIHVLLTEAQHRSFHAYLKERGAAVGLPIDRSHGAPRVGTLGSPGTVGHAPGESHDGPAARREEDTAAARPFSREPGKRESMRAAVGPSALSRHRHPDLWPIPSCPLTFAART